MIISVCFKQQTVLYIAMPLTHTLFLQDSDVSLVTQVSLEEGCIEGGIILDEQLPSSEPEPLTSSEHEDHLPSFGLEDHSYFVLKERPCSGEVPSTSSSSPCPLSPPPALTLPGTEPGPSRISTAPGSTSNKRRRSKSSDPVDHSLAVLSNYFEQRTDKTVVDFPYTLGQMVETAARKLPWNEQLKLAMHIFSFVSDSQERTESAK